MLVDANLHKNEIVRSCLTTEERIRYCERRQDAIVVMLLRLYAQSLTPDRRRNNAFVETDSYKIKQRHKTLMARFYNIQLVGPVFKNWNL